MFNVPYIYIYVYLMQSIVCTIYRMNSIAIREQFNFNFDFLNKLTKTKKYDMRKKIEGTLRKIYLYIHISLYTLFTNLGFNCDRF